MEPTIYHFNNSTANYSRVMAHQLAKETKIDVLHDNVGAARSTRNSDESKMAGILYQGQGRHAFRNKAGSKLFESSQNKKKFDPLTIMGCFSCGEPSRMLADCKNDVDLVNAANRRLGYI